MTTVAIRVTAWSFSAILVALLVLSLLHYSPGQTGSWRVPLEDFDTVTVEAKAADVLVRPALPNDSPHAVLVASYGGEAPRRSIEEGVLSARCPGGVNLFHSCRLRWELRIDPRRPVVVTTRSGDVDVSGVGGPLAVETRSGDVTIGSATCPDIAVATRSGDIDVANTAQAQVRATSRSGDINLWLDRPPTDVVAEAHSGEITVRVPPDGTGYATHLESESASVTNSVRRAPSSERTIRAKTRSGDIAVTQG